MSGALTWWANRKSQIGLKPIAKEPPPLAPGRAWWTSPPIAAPSPEHMEYAVAFMSEILAMPPSDTRNALQSYMGAWLRKARQLLHEQMFEQRGSAACTSLDGFLLAAADALYVLVGQLKAAGIEPDARALRVKSQIEGRATVIRRRKVQGK